MLIIGIGGQRRNGKDTVADYLQVVLNKDNLQWERISFAKKVKTIACDAFGVSMDFIEEWKVKTEIPPGFDMPMRDVLVMIGDGFREAQGNVWINNALSNLTNPSICSDVRYINELKVTKGSGGVTVLVWMKGRENDDPNGSEAQIRPLVDFFKATGLEGDVVQQLKSMNKWPVTAPYGADMVDLFIRNEGTVSDLDNKVLNIVAPYVKAKWPNKVFQDRILIAGISNELLSMEEESAYSA